jgi:ssDNA-binding Zn-finger/Zn-ribbon topoisomerase 1
MEWKKVIAGKRDGICYNCGFLFESAFQVGAVDGEAQLCVECAEIELNQGQGSPTIKDNRSSKGIVSPKLCPKCHSKQIVFAKGGTCYIPNPKINWLCSNCLWEW